MDYKDHFGFLYKARQTVYKWWCVVYKPTYKLFHHGYWPAEKEPYYQMNQAKAISEEPAVTSDNTTPDTISNAEDLANQILKSKQGNVDDMVANTSPIKAQEETDSSSEQEVDLSTVDPDALSRANEIMARLAAEAASDEAKKQAEIDAAKAKARADEEEAKAKAKAEEAAAKARADEVMARLAAEAAADDAKKQEEIEVAKAKADEDARVASIMKAAKVDISAFIEEGKAQRNTNI